MTIHPYNHFHPESSTANVITPTCHFVQISCIQSGFLEVYGHILSDADLFVYKSKSNKKLIAVKEQIFFYVKHFVVSGKT